MIKILIVGLKEPTGGVESAVMEQVRHLDKNEVRADFAIFGDNFSYKQEIEKMGGRVIFMPSRIRKPLEYKARLKATFKDGNYDAVWCNFSGLTNIDFLKFAKANGVPVRIAHAHTSRFAWGNKLMKYLVPIMHYKNQRIVDRFATHFFTCSDLAADFMFGNRISKKAILIKNAVDTEKYKRNQVIRAEAREEFFLADHPTIIHIGRMCAAKNQLFLLDIFEAVLEKKPDAKLLFVGDGELWTEVTEYAKTKNFGDKVIFTGNRSDVPRLLQAADAFLLPSITEGLPVTGIEAQAAGLCCVVSKDVVTDKLDVTGNVKFVPLDANINVWADTVIDAFGKYMSEAYKKVAENGFDSRVSAKALQEFFIKGE